MKKKSVFAALAICGLACGLPLAAHAQLPWVLLYRKLHEHRESGSTLLPRGGAPAPAVSYKKGDSGVVPEVSGGCKTFQDLKDHMRAVAMDDQARLAELSAGGHCIEIPKGTTAVVLNNDFIDGIDHPIPELRLLSGKYAGMEVWTDSGVLISPPPSVTPSASGKGEAQ